MVAENPRAIKNRAVLLISVVVSVVAGWALATSLSVPVVRPDGLGRVLKGMVLIKGGMMTGAVALVFSRLGRVIATRSAVGYIAGTVLSGFAVGVLWSLSFISLGSALFYLGLLVSIWGLSRDRELLEGWREPEAAVDVGGSANRGADGRSALGHNGVEGHGTSSPDHEDGHPGTDRVPAGVASGDPGEEETDLG